MKGKDDSSNIHMQRSICIFLLIKMCMCAHIYVQNFDFWQYKNEWLVSNIYTFSGIARVSPSALEPFQMVGAKQANQKGEASCKI